MQTVNSHKSTEKYNNTTKQCLTKTRVGYMDGLAQNYINCSTLAMELLQICP